jgi:hypothetical protein
VSIIRGEQQTIGSSVEFDRCDVQKGDSFDPIDRDDEQRRRPSHEIERDDIRTIGDTARSDPCSVKK